MDAGEREHAGPTRSRWRAALFLGFEAALIVSIPLLAWFGFQNLLGSRSGAYVIDPTSEDPGWLAFVDPTPVSLIVETADARVGGLALLIPSGANAPGGAVILVPGSLMVDGDRLTDLAPEAVSERLATMLRLDFDNVVIADEAGWQQLIGDAQIPLSNPDPVPGPDGEVLFAVGDLVLDAATVSAFLGRSGVASTTSGTSNRSESLALEFRRDVFWRALLANTDLLMPTQEPTDPNGDQQSPAEVARGRLVSIAAADYRVEAMPTNIADVAGTTGNVDADPAQVEALLNEFVALPAGVGRLEVRILDRTGTNDLENAARSLGRAGFQVVQIGNASVFDGLTTQVINAPGADSVLVTELAALLGADIVVSSNDEEAVSTVTVLLGTNNQISSPDE